MNYEEAKVTVRIKYFSNSLRTKSVSNSRGELNLVYLFQTRTSNGVTTVLS